MTARSLLSLPFVTLIAGIACAADPNDAADEELTRQLTAIVNEHRGDVALVIQHEHRGEIFSHNAQQVMPTASLIKFPVMIEAYRQAEAGSLDLDTMIELQATDEVPGSGILTQHFSPGLKISIRDAVRLMIAYSDNTATNLVLDQIGLDSTAKSMTQLGFPDTQIHSKVYRGDTTIAPERSRTYGLGSTRARDMVELLLRLHRKELVSQSASEEMRRHLLACDDDTRLGRSLPPDVAFAHKTGAVSSARCDAGLIETPYGAIAVCAMTSQNEDRSWAADNEADVLLAKIGSTIMAQYGAGAQDAPGVQAVPEPEQLQLGDFGVMVEAVQRTLNSRLDPSPDLSIDGDFGPMTQSALRSFQRASKLNDTGIVDEATWKSLSPLLVDAAPVSSPDEVNREVLAREAADLIDGPPFVTCAAWGIADAVTGKLVGAKQADKSLPIASTTKVMTAYLVLRYISDNPEALKERITFSRRADQTRGSTSGIREGESVPVIECLYGMLLPSGNDASVALAEHFGRRIWEQDGNPAEAASSDDAMTMFVNAMNHCASELGMEQTSFRNTSGLHDADHYSSVSDLLTLTSEAVKDPTFRKLVSTRQRGCAVLGATGYERYVIWKNTNDLLGVEGYDGVKTGTTDAAGACLIAMSERNDRQFLLVLLGAASSRARYSDARNLFRWAWIELAASE